MDMRQNYLESHKIIKLCELGCYQNELQMLFFFKVANTEKTRKIQNETVKITKFQKNISDKKKPLKNPLNMYNWNESLSIIIFNFTEFHKKD